MPSSLPQQKPRIFFLSQAALILLVTLLFAGRWSGHKLLNQDEMFAYQTDTVRTLGEVVHIQLHYPISLDPLVYHTLAHVSTRVFGPTAFAMRLPSMLGYALMQFCVLLFVYRAARTRYEEFQARQIAQFAAILPLATATFYYATEARPYGLLLGFYALALLSWQAATRALDEESSTNRSGSLVTLALAVGFALNSHYFAILLLPVLYLAELVRTFDRRKLDLPLVCALIAGTASIAFTLPFQHAMRSFRTHYYNAGTISVRAVTQAYRSLIVDYTSASLRTQHFAAILFIVLALVFLTALVLRWRTLALPRGEAVLLVATAALPFFGFLLARFVTHSYEVRYVIDAIIGITILVALLLAPAIVSATRTARQQRWLPYVVGFAAVLILGIEAAHEQHKSENILRSLEVPAAVREALANDPAHNLYIQQMGHYEIAQFYQPDPVVRAHTVLVYDSAREIRLTGHDTEALTAEHMQHFTALPIVSYDSLARDAAPHTWLLYNDGWDFAHKALVEDGAAIATAGEMFDGKVARVEFPRK